MELKDILAELDQEIARLQQARTLLGGEVAKKRTAKKKTAVVKPAPKKRKLTPEGRKRIAEAMKRRQLLSAFRRRMAWFHFDAYSNIYKVRTLREPSCSALMEGRLGDFSSL